MSERLGKAERLDVFELSRSRGHREGAIRLADMPRLAAMLVDVDGQLSYTVDGLVDGQGHPGAMMRLGGEVRMSCNRCGKPVTIELDREVPFRFVHTEAEADAIPIDEDDETEIIVGSSTLGLADWVEEEAILSLPIAPRHDDCSAPGFDSGDNPKEELADDRRRPFAVLETLKRGKMN